MFADADPETAFEGSANGVFWNQGQICSAGTRVYVEAPVYDDAVNAFVDRASAIVLGDGLDEATEMGPLVSLEQLERVAGYIEVGEREAKLAGRGTAPTTPASRAATSSRRRSSPTSTTRRGSRARRSSGR